MADGSGLEAIFRKLLPAIASTTAFMDGQIPPELLAAVRGWGPLAQLQWAVAAIVCC